MKENGMNKPIRYQWEKLNGHGRELLIPVADLKIDKRYQRREVSETNTLSIARDFSWNAFGTLVVMEREGGEKYVVDGQQRLSAAIRRGDISAVPCLVFKSSGPEEEAQVFLKLNCNRKYVTSHAKFNAGAMAGQYPEAEIVKWLSTIGLRITPDGKCLHGVSFPGYLVSTWSTDSENAKRAIDIQLFITGGMEPLHHALHLGIFTLLRHGINVLPEVSKIRSLGGKTAILNAIRAHVIEAGLKGTSAMSCAFGVLRIINFRRKKKIVLSLAGNE